MSTNPRGPESVTGDAREDSGRVKSSGVSRDRIDKNTVSDDFDLASARLALGKKRSTAGSDAGESASGAEGGGEKEAPSRASEAPRASPQAASQPADLPTSPMSSMAPKSNALPPTSITASPPMGAASLSASPPAQRIPSRIGTPVGSPAAPASPALSRQGSVQGSFAGPSGAPLPLSRQGSRASAAGAGANASFPRSPQQQVAGGGGGSRKTSVAGSEHGYAAPSNPPLSRQGSAAQLAASQTPLSRQGSVSSRHSAANSTAAAPFMAGEPPRQYLPEATPPSAPLDADDDFEIGVDWRLTTNTLRNEIKKLEKRLLKKDEELVSENRVSAQMRERNADLESRLQKALSTKGSKGERESAIVHQLKEQAEKDRITIAKLETTLSAKEKTIRDLKHKTLDGQRNSLTPQSQSLIGGPASTPQVEALQNEVARLRASSDRRERLVKDLSQQLESAHEAIVSAAQMGFEYDVKLHQARATLVTLLQKERLSPRRSAGPGYGSPSNFNSNAVAYASSPVYASSPPRFGQPHSQSFLKTPPSRTSLR
ncbi:hypothetical protein DIPPA_32822 [Diplonema papillatum]|nr:hypothetical protein DIPPA_31450 [Diplonema papillatum]KAJ9455475.1 hypothetical protein DIPPA_32822 [Diplonema papillatum]